MDIFIKKINMTYGSFVDQTIEFSPNFNLVFGQNEEGKSTIFSFIKDMLYGQYMQGHKNLTKDKDLFLKYRPWYSGAYKGSMKIVRGGEELLIYRDFNNDQYIIKNLSKGQDFDIQDPRKVGDYILGLDYNEFCHYIAMDFKNPLISSSSSIIDNLIKNNPSAVSTLNFDKLKIELEKRNKEIGTDRVSQKDLGRINKKIQGLNIRLNAIEANEFDYESMVEGLEKSKKTYKYYSNLALYKKYYQDIENRPSFDDYEYVKDLMDELACDKESSSMPSLLALIPLGLALILGLIFYKKNFLTPIVFLIIGITGSGLALTRAKKRPYNKEEIKEEIYRVFNKAGVSSMAEFKDLVSSGSKDLKLTLFNHEFLDLDIESRLIEAKDLYEAKSRSLILYKEKIQEKRDLIEERKSLEEEKNLLLEELETNKLILDSLDILSKDAFHFFKEDIEDKLSQSLNYFSLGKYKRLNLREDFSIEVFDSRKNSYISLYGLSLGTVELINLAFKISIRKLRIKDSLPLVLDNSFNFMDGPRKTRFIEFLNDYSKSNQLILFSNRESDLLGANENTNLIRLNGGL